MSKRCSSVFTSVHSSSQSITFRLTIVNGLHMYLTRGLFIALSTTCSQHLTTRQYWTSTEQCIPSPNWFWRKYFSLFISSKSAFPKEIFGFENVLAMEVSPWNLGSLWVRVITWKQHTVQSCNVNYSTHIYNVVLY